jgi:hypothetical protein
MVRSAAAGFGDLGEKRGEPFALDSLQVKQFAPTRSSGWAQEVRSGAGDAKRSRPSMSTIMITSERS